MYGKGVTTDSHFIERALGGIREFTASTYERSTRSSNIRIATVAAGKSHPDDRLVEARRQPGQQASLPGQQRRPAQAAGRPHGPVFRQVQMLEHVRLPADHDSLEPSP